MKGYKVIAAMFAGLALSFGLAGLGFVIFEPEASPCATGELAENRYIGPDFETRIENFESVSDAGAFICHKVATLDAEDWELAQVSAERTVPTEFLVQGYGIGIVSQTYEHTATGDSLTLHSAPYSTGPTYFEERLPGNVTQERVMIGEIEATVYRFGINPDLVHVQWTTRTMQHEAVAQLTETLPLDDLATLLQRFE